MTWTDIILVYPSVAGLYARASVSAVANSTYGTFRASIMSHIGTCSTFGGFGTIGLSAYVRSGFSDVWTVDSGAAGTPGSLVLSFDVTGSGFALLLAELGAPSSPLQTLVNGDGTYTLTIPVASGVPTPNNVILSLSLIAASTGVVEIDYAHTAVLTSATLLQGGNAVPFNLTTESGAAAFEALDSGSGGGSAVPEPGSMLSAALGLACLAARKLSAAA